MKRNGGGGITDQFRECDQRLGDGASDLAGTIRLTAHRRRRGAAGGFMQVAR
jgi:hypothetical protein